MLLIYPPMAKACEPPAGITCLAGVLRGHGYGCTLLDANLEGQLHLLGHQINATDTWSSRAQRNLASNLAGLRSSGLYRTPARYQRAVSDLNRLLALTAQPELSLSLANYQDSDLSPLKSADLLQAAASPATNIFHAYFKPRLADLLATARPPLIGISINYLSQALPAFAMIGFLKKNYPDLPIVAGGGLITSWLRNPAWRNPFGTLIDHLVAGPGETALLKLLAGRAAACPATGRDNPGRSTAPIPSLPYPAPARELEASPPRITNQPTTAVNLCPDYSGLPLDDYLAPGLILPYAASSGCYWRKCSFCPETAECNPYLSLPPEVVLEQIKQLKARHRPTLLHFLDNAISPALMQALIARPPGLAWYSFARVGPALADLEFCRSLRRSGCIMLKLGLESGDQKVLEAMDKGIDLALVATALANLEKAGIATYVYLLFGTPTESLAAARRTLAFTVKHRSAITFLNLAIFNMPLATPEAATLATSDFYEGDLALYTNFSHPLGWQRQDIRRFLDREFKRHPAIIPILRRDPPFFSSNHAPFFCL